MMFGPTEWIQLPHECPPGAIEAWFAVHLVKEREPFFKKVET